jgi:hypothetical protein
MQIHTTLGKESIIFFEQDKGNACYGGGIGNDRNQHAQRMDLHT